MMRGGFMRHLVFLDFNQPMGCGAYPRGHV